MAILGFELEEIVRLLALLEASGLDEMVWEEEGRYLRIRGPRLEKPPRSHAPPPPAGSPALATTRSQKRLPPAHSLPKANVGAKDLPSDQVALEAPMVGIFYRAEKPGAPPLVTIGQHVTVGQSIGIIEAMKIFSEVPAEHAGAIIAIPAQDGQLVQAGMPLVILRREDP